MIVDLVAHLKNSLDFEFYPSIAPKSALVPFGVYTIVSETERISVNLGSYQSDYLIQLDIYTKTYKEANLLKDRLKEVLFNFKRPIIELNFNISFDDEVYRLMVELESFV